jgi:hypothetical protein
LADGAHAKFIMLYDLWYESQNLVERKGRALTARILHHLLINQYLQITPTLGQHKGKSIQQSFIFRQHQMLNIAKQFYKLEMKKSILMELQESMRPLLFKLIDDASYVQHFTT